MGVRGRAAWAAGALLVALGVLVPAGAAAQGVSDGSDASLSALSLSGADLGFDPAETEYWVAYGAAVEYPTVSAVAAQAGASVSISPADADIVAPGHQAEVLAFQPVRVTVTSADGTATRIYSLWMFDFRLQSLGVEGHDIGFDPFTAEYSLEVPAVTESATLSVDETKHTVAYSHPDADPDTEGHQVGLDVGDNTITVTATPKSRIILAPQTYTLTVTRLPLALEANQNDEQEEEEEVVVLDNDPPAANADASLSSLELTGATLGFDAATLSYDVDFVAAADHATIAAEANDAGATVEITPTDDDDNAEGHQIAITSGGTTTATVTVTASDTTTTQTYQLNITDTRLRGLGIDGYDIGFDAATASYTLSVPNSVDAVTVGTGTEANTKLDIAYSPATDADDNTEGHQVDLAVGANTITATATLTGGTATATYTITITRNGDASLSSLTIDPGFLRLDPYSSSHTAYVLPSTESVTVTAEANDADATVEITPTDADDITEGHQIATTDDTVTVTVTVTDADSTTTTHTLTIKHRPGGFVKIDVGVGTACALHLSGRVLCWGRHRSDWFYDAPHGGRRAVSPPADEKYVDIAVGFDGSCGIRSDDTVHCWEEHRSVVPAGEYWSIAVDMLIPCWLDTERNLGCTHDHYDALTESGEKYRAVAVARRVVCAVGMDHQVDCDGTHAFHEAGRNSPEGEFKSVSGGGGGHQFFCGLKTDGSAQCWEYRYQFNGYVVNEEAGFYTGYPARSGPYIDVSTSYRRSCGVKSDNTVECWRGGGSLPSGFAYETVSTGAKYFLCGLTTGGGIKCAGTTEGGEGYPVHGDTSLREVRLSDLDLDFDDESTTHSVGHAYDSDSTTITVTPRLPWTTFQIAPADADLDTGGHQIELTGDSVTVTVTVTSFDGTSETVHTIVIDRTAPPDEARLKSLSISSDPGPFGRVPDSDVCVDANADPDIELQEIWSDGETLWLADPRSDKLWAYDLESCEAKPDSDIDTSAAGNNVPIGVWSDGTTMWVSDKQDAQIYAYDLSSGERQAGSDIGSDTLRAAGNGSPSGIWSDETTLWVADGVDAKIYAYDLSSGERRSGSDIDTLSGAGNIPTGIWSDGVILWVTDELDDKLYAYELDGGARRAELDFDSPEDAGDRTFTGLWSDGETVWISDDAEGANAVYAYAMIQYDATLASDSTLASIDVELDFDDDTYLYRADVAADVASVTVAPTAYDPDATVAVLPFDAESGTDGHQVSLSAGEANFITISVMSEDTTEVVTYTIVITRPDS